ncbi:4-hydroxy-tetrahydrodipicolinate reductase [Sphingomonas sp. BN140010]|uniref:4-hydroxy-tetrahydrodipicolinate reductase n=1 Tax=Sphingomonas arvum TaxID=2992113 RepID=A0ABT3JHS6_9SPHN|nr:4-hydroxy-tetrahydrodipicolinate reductase [Sphingomonas sp. BN140010]MCW3798633.1 4-hydroxy-tetrahydrodipicolinate reductase [Sphingomonas sp. BN140010]
MMVNNAPIRLALVAPDGRMGKAIALAVAEDSRFALDQNDADVLIDFSAPSALSATLERAMNTQTPVLVGTTGLESDAKAALEGAAKKVAVLQASNTSLGVALLADLVERAAHVLGDDWDIEIAEVHHRNKADAPSGTALALGEAAARGRSHPLRAERARDGTGLERQRGTVGFAALRGGSVAGDHDVMFLGPEERLILSHRAESRKVFARGTLAAANFLRGRMPGLYTMRDVIAAL